MKTSPQLDSAMADALDSVERIESASKADTSDAPKDATQTPEDAIEVEVADESSAEEVEVEFADETTAEADGGDGKTDSLDERNKELQEQLLRLAADFENFRKRSRRERDEQRQFAAEDVLRDFLPILDNLDRALNHAERNGNGDGENNNAGANAIVEGVRMVAKQFTDVLASHNVNKFPSVGELFDPELHEAMGRGPATDTIANGEVLQELEPGYQIGDRLLRPAKVIVAFAEDSAEKTAETTENAPQEIDDVDDEQGAT